MGCNLRTTVPGGGNKLLNFLGIFPSSVPKHHSPHLPFSICSNGPSPTLPGLQSQDLGLCSLLLNTRRTSHQLIHQEQNRAHLPFLKPSVTAVCPFSTQLLQGFLLAFHEALLLDPFREHQVSMASDFQCHTPDMVTTSFLTIWTILWPSRWLILKTAILVTIVE